MTFFLYYFLIGCRDTQEGNGWSCSSFSTFLFDVVVDGDMGFTGSIGVKIP